MPEKNAHTIYRFVCMYDLLLGCRSSRFYLIELECMLVALMIFLKHKFYVRNSIRICIFLLYTIFGARIFFFSSFTFANVHTTFF